LMPRSTRRETDASKQPDESDRTEARERRATRAPTLQRFTVTAPDPSQY
jgi:hypothetical protein